MKEYLKYVVIVETEDCSGDQDVRMISDKCFHFIVFQDRLAMESKSHTTEIMQKTRIELENGDISSEEISESIRVSCSISFQVGSQCRPSYTYIVPHSTPAGPSIPSQAVRMHAGRPR
jgi:hypothetical protein